MFCPMDPLVENSVTRVGPYIWLLGSLYTCEVVDNVSTDTVASWEDDGKIYHIRKSSTDERSSVSSDSASGRIHHAGTSAAVWNIGGVFIKVKAWRDVPIPEVIFSWVNVDWNRSFLILKALKGQTLDQAWESLSTDRRIQVADKIAAHCSELALATSEMLMTENGSGLQDGFLTPCRPNTEPSWRPKTLGPYSSNELRAFHPESQVWTSHTGLLYFYHADLGPSNIIVSEDGNIVGVIDWECAAYYPKFWLGTKPYVSAGFLLKRADERRAWATLLRQSLERNGFPLDIETYHMWEKVVGQ